MTEKKRYYNSVPINDNPESDPESRPLSARRAEDEAISLAQGKVRRTIERRAEEKALNAELEDWNYV